MSDVGKNDAVILLAKSLFFDSLWGKFGELALFLMSGLVAEMGFTAGYLVSDLGAGFVNCQSSVCLYRYLHSAVEARTFMAIYACLAGAVHGSSSVLIIGM
ncbi:hypothetical protein [Shewanella sp. cp20]|uniref:hypothetical protein n=1 Tax=Shewanella sp. cp20 TaxID=1521167 RepID=UPI0005A18FBD|nr:hypothetical protein [Shewanella sp. cp20]KIO35105.1 hypothetical protein DB48_17700 [Shewanella sp. cp20]